MKDGRIVADIGEELKREWKAILAKKGIIMTDWLKEVIGKFVKEGEK